MPVRLRGANPSRETVTVYTPTATEGAEKVPPSAVTNLRSLPVSSLRMTTSARATAEPAGSTTSPEMVPPTICALARVQARSGEIKANIGSASRKSRINELLEIFSG